MAALKSVKIDHESSRLLSSPSTQPAPYNSLHQKTSRPSTHFKSKDLDLKAMFETTSYQRGSKPFVLFSSAGLALLFIGLCAFSADADAASVARTLIGLDNQAGRLEPRTTTSSYAYQRMLANVGGASDCRGQSSAERPDRRRHGLTFYRNSGRLLFFS